MSDIPNDIAEHVEALCAGRQHAEPRWEWDRNRHRKPLDPYRTIVPGLIQQLRELAEEGATNTNDSGVHSVPESSPPGAFDAVALIAAITFGAAWRVGWLREARTVDISVRDTPEANLSAIVGALPRVDSDTQRDIRAEVRSWRRQAEVLTGWTQPPIELVAPCPVVDIDGHGTPCNARGTLLAQRDGSGARCVACGAQWDEANIGLLLAHVQRYTEASKAAAEKARLKVRAEKEAARERERVAREARQSAA